MAVKRLAAACSRLMRATFLVCLGMIAWPALLLAQTGVISGRIDSSLLGAWISAEVLALPHDAAGETSAAAIAPVVAGARPCEWQYRIAGLPPGRYSIGLRPAAVTTLNKRSTAFRALAQVTVEPGRVTAADLGAPVILRVGPARRLRRPSDAAAVASDGTVIEIDAGTYTGDVAVWRQSGITLRGAGGYAYVRAAGQHAQGKAIWVITGTDVRVEHIAFSGAKVPDGNGAGIRHEGENLAVCDSLFHANENGILGGGGSVLVEHSEFGHNGAGDGYTHNMYISERTERFTLRHSYSHHAHVGHLVKSRARSNFLLYNRLTDETDGDSSYAVDLPNGGAAYLIGNIIQQGPRSENHGIVAFAAELEQGSEQDRFYAINNTFINDQRAGTFLSIKTGARAILFNNLIVGPGRLLRGEARMRATLSPRDAGFVDRKNYDYRLTAASPARDAGIDPGADGDIALRPVKQYVHRAKGEVRPRVGRIDVGAYEYAP